MKLQNDITTITQAYKGIYQSTQESIIEKIAKILPLKFINDGSFTLNKRGNMMINSGKFSSWRRFAINRNHERQKNHKLL